MYGITKDKFLKSQALHYLNGEGNGTLLQYSCLENPMGRGAWWAAVHGVAESRTRLSYFTHSLLGDGGSGSREVMYENRNY